MQPPDITSALQLRSAPRKSENACPIMALGRSPRLAGDLGWRGIPCLLIEYRMA